MVRTILSVLLLLLLLGLLVRSLFDRQVVSSFHNPVPWAAGIITIGLMVLGWINEWPNFWENYESVISPTVYVGNRVLNMLGQALIYGVAAFTIALLFIRLPSQVFSQAPQASDLLAMVKRPPWRWRGSREGFAWAVALVVFGWLRTHFFNNLSDEIPTDLFDTAYGPFATFLPSSVILASFWTGLLYWAAFAVGLSALKRTLGLRVGGSLFLGTSLLVMALTPDQNWWVASNHLLGLMILAFIILRVIRFHIPFYFWFAFLSSSYSFLPWLFSETLAFRQQAALVLLTILLMFTMLFVRLPSPRENSLTPSNPM